LSRYIFNLSPFAQETSVVSKAEGPGFSLYAPASLNFLPDFTGPWSIRLLHVIAGCDAGPWHSINDMCVPSPGLKFSLCSSYPYLLELEVPLLTDFSAPRLSLSRAPLFPSVLPITAPFSRSANCSMSHSTLPLPFLPARFAEHL